MLNEGASQTVEQAVLGELASGWSVHAIGPLTNNLKD